MLIRANCQRKSTTKDRILFLAFTLNGRWKIEIIRGTIWVETKISDFFFDWNPLTYVLKIKFFGRVDCDFLRIDTIHVTGMIFHTKTLDSFWPIQIFEMLAQHTSLSKTRSKLKKYWSLTCNLRFTEKQSENFKIWSVKQTGLKKLCDNQKFYWIDLECYYFKHLLY